MLSNSSTQQPSFKLKAPPKRKTQLQHEQQDSEDQECVEDDGGKYQVYSSREGKYPSRGGKAKAFEYAKGERQRRGGGGSGSAFRGRLTTRRDYLDRYDSQYGKYSDQESKKYKYTEQDSKKAELKFNLPEDTRISKLLRRLSVEEDPENSLQISRKLLEVLLLPDNAPYVKKSFNILRDSILQILYAAPGLQAKKQCARAFGRMGYILAQDSYDFSKYLKVILKPKLIEEETVCLYMESLKETLRLDREKQILDKNSVYYLMNDLINLIENTDNVEIFQTVLNNLIDCVEFYPNNFFEFFKDTIDLLFGWHVDHTQPLSNIEFISCNLRRISNHFQMNLDFSLTLIVNFIEDIETYGNQILKNETVISDNVEHVTVFILALNTVLQCLNKGEKEKNNEIFSVKLILDALTKIVTILTKTLEHSIPENLIMAGNKSLTLLLELLSVKNSALVELILRLVDSELAIISDLNNPAIISTLLTISKIIKELSANLPINLIKKLVGPESQLIQLRSSPFEEIQEATICVYQALLNLKNIPLLQEAYRYVLSDLEVAFKIINPEIGSLTMSLQDIENITFKFDLNKQDSTIVTSKFDLNTQDSTNLTSKFDVKKQDLTTPTPISDVNKQGLTNLSYKFDVNKDLTILNSKFDLNNQESTNVSLKIDINKQDLTNATSKFDLNTRDFKDVSSKIDLNDMESSTCLMNGTSVFNSDAHDSRDVSSLRNLLNAAPTMNPNRLELGDVTLKLNSPECNSANELNNLDLCDPNKMKGSTFDVTSKLNSTPASGNLSKRFSTPSIFGDITSKLNVDAGEMRVLSAKYSKTNDITSKFGDLKDQAVNINRERGFSSSNCNEIDELTPKLNVNPLEERDSSSKSNKVDDITSKFNRKTQDLNNKTSGTTKLNADKQEIRGLQTELDQMGEITSKLNAKNQEMRDVTLKLNTDNKDMRGTASKLNTDAREISSILNTRGELTTSLSEIDKLSDSPSNFDITALRDITLKSKANSSEFDLTSNFNLNSREFSEFSSNFYKVQALSSYFNQIDEITSQLNPFSSLKYDFEEAGIVALFLLRCLSQLANASGSIIGMWALKPSILELLGVLLQPYNKKLEKIPGLQFSLIFLLYSHCKCYNFFVSSSDLVRQKSTTRSLSADAFNPARCLNFLKNADNAVESVGNFNKSDLLQDVTKSPNSGNFSIILDVLYKIFKFSDNPEILLLVLKWSKEIFAISEPYLEILYTNQQFLKVVKVMIEKCGYSKDKGVILEVGNNLERLLSNKQLSWRNCFLKEVNKLCVLRMGSCHGEIRGMFARLFTNISWDVSVLEIGKLHENPSEREKNFEGDGNEDGDEENARNEVANILRGVNKISLLENMGGKRVNIIRKENAQMNNQNNFINNSVNKEESVKKLKYSGSSNESKISGAYEKLQKSEDCKKTMLITSSSSTVQQDQYSADLIIGAYSEKQEVAQESDENFEGLRNPRALKENADVEKSKSRNLETAKNSTSFSKELYDPPSFSQQIQSLKEFHANSGYKFPQQFQSLSSNSSQFPQQLQSLNFNSSQFPQQLQSPNPNSSELQSSDPNSQFLQQLQSLKHLQANPSVLQQLQRILDLNLKSGNLNATFLQALNVCKNEDDGGDLKEYNSLSIFKAQQLHVNGVLYGEILPHHFSVFMDYLLKNANPDAKNRNSEDYCESAKKIGFSESKCGGSKIVSLEGKDGTKTIYVAAEKSGPAAKSEHLFGGKNPPKNNSNPTNSNKIALSLEKADPLDFLKTIFSSSWPLEAESQDLSDEFREICTLSQEVLNNWITWEAAQYCVNNKLRTTLGKPNETFTSFENCLKKLAKEIMTTKHQNFTKVKQEEDGSRTEKDSRIRQEDDGIQNKKNLRTRQEEDEMKNRKDSRTKLEEVGSKVRQEKDNDKEDLIRDEMDETGFKNQIQTEIEGNKSKKDLKMMRGNVVGQDTDGGKSGVKIMKAKPDDFKRDDVEEEENAHLQDKENPAQSKSSLNEEGSKTGLDKDIVGNLHDSRTGDAKKTKQKGGTEEQNSLRDLNRDDPKSGDDLEDLKTVKIKQKDEKGNKQDLKEGQIKQGIKILQQEKDFKVLQQKDEENKQKVRIQQKQDIKILKQENEDDKQEIKILQQKDAKVQKEEKNKPEIKIQQKDDKAQNQQKEKDSKIQDMQLKENDKDVKIQQKEKEPKMDVKIQLKEKEQKSDLKIQQDESHISLVDKQDSNSKLPQENKDVKQKLLDALKVKNQEDLKRKSPINRNPDDLNKVDIKRVHLLLTFIDHLEKLIHNAAEGSALAIPQPSKPVRTFFTTNLQTCKDWLSRIRIILIQLSLHAGQNVLALRHGQELIKDFINTNKQDGVDFERTVMYVTLALLNLKESEAIYGLYVFCKHAAKRKFPWIKAASDQALNKFEIAAKAYEKLIGEVNEDVYVMNFISDQIINCYKELNNWKEIVDYKNGSMNLLFVESENSLRYSFNTVSFDCARALWDFEKSQELDNEARIVLLDRNLQNARILKDVSQAKDDPQSMQLSRSFSDGPRNLRDFILCPEPLRNFKNAQNYPKSGGAESFSEFPQHLENPQNFETPGQTQSFSEYKFNSLLLENPKIQDFYSSDIEEKIARDCVEEKTSPGFEGKLFEDFDQLLMNTQAFNELSSWKELELQNSNSKNSWSVYDALSVTESNLYDIALNIKNPILEKLTSKLIQGNRKGDEFSNLGDLQSRFSNNKERGDNFPNKIDALSNNDFLKNINELQFVHNQQLLNRIDESLGKIRMFMQDNITHLPSLFLKDFALLNYVANGLKNVVNQKPASVVFLVSEDFENEVDKIDSSTLSKILWWSEYFARVQNQGFNTFSSNLRLNIIKKARKESNYNLAVTQLFKFLNNKNLLNLTAKSKAGTLKAQDFSFKQTGSAQNSNSARRKTGVFLVDLAESFKNKIPEIDLWTLDTAKAAQEMIKLLYNEKNEGRLLNKERYESDRKLYKQERGGRFNSKENDGGFTLGDRDRRSSFNKEEKDFQGDDDTGRRCHSEENERKFYLDESERTFLNPEITGRFRSEENDTWRCFFSTQESQDFIKSEGNENYKKLAFDLCAISTTSISKCADIYGGSELKQVSSKILLKLATWLQINNNEVSLTEINTPLGKFLSVLPEIGTEIVAGNSNLSSLGGNANLSSVGGNTNLTPLLTAENNTEVEGLNVGGGNSSNYARMDNCPINKFNIGENLIPINEMMIGKLLQFSVNQCQGLAKNWNAFGTWCYRWGKKIVDNSSDLTNTLTEEDKTRIKSVIPEECSEEEFQRILMILSQTRNHVDDEDIDNNEVKTSEIIRNQLKNVPVLSRRRFSERAWNNPEGTLSKGRRDAEISNPESAQMLGKGRNNAEISNPEGVQIMSKGSRDGGNEHGFWKLQAQVERKVLEKDLWRNPEDQKNLISIKYQNPEDDGSENAIERNNPDLWNSRHFTDVSKCSSESAVSWKTDDISAESANLQQFWKTENPLVACSDLQNLRTRIEFETLQTPHFWKSSNQEEASAGSSGYLSEKNNERLFWDERNSENRSPQYSEDYWSSTDNALMPTSSSMIERNNPNYWKSVNQDYPLTSQSIKINNPDYTKYVNQKESQSTIEMNNWKSVDHLSSTQNYPLLIKPITPEETIDDLVQIWKNLQKRIYAYYGLSVEAYFKYLHLTSSSENITKATEANTVTVTLRLLRLIVKHALELQNCLEEGLAKTPTQPWKIIIPQLFSRLNHPESFVRERVSELLCRVAEDSPHLITFPAVVGALEGGVKFDFSEISLPKNCLSQKNMKDCFNNSKDCKEEEKVLSENDEDDDDDDDDEEEEIYESDDDCKDILQACFKSMVETLSKKTPETIKQVKLLVKELRRIILLWDELWLGTLAQHHGEIQKRQQQLELEIEKVNSNKNLNPEEKISLISEKHRIILKPIIFILEQLNEITSVEPETPHEKQFQEKFSKAIAEVLLRLKNPEHPERPQESWKLLKDLQNQFQQKSHKTRNLLKMQEISPILSNITNTLISMPGQTLKKKVYIQKVSTQVSILPTKTKPKKLIFYGSDGKIYTYLFKGLEDLHLDERIMQFLSITNKLLAQNSEGTGHNLYRARHYSVIPLGPRSGLISWVGGTTPVFSLYKRWQQREAQKLNNSKNPQILRPSELFYNKLNPLLQDQGIKNLENRKEWPLVILKQVLTELMAETPGDLLSKELWLNSINPKNYWQVVKKYNYSVAVMSIIGYVIGLGDRHLDNVLVDLSTGEVVHIDYNVCFEKGKTLRVPEKVPFRLTPNIRDALGVTGIEGMFRLACEHILKTMKKGRETLLTLLEAFVYDPLVDWTVGNDGLVGTTFGGISTNTTHKKQTRKDLEKEVTLAMYRVRCTEMKTDWDQNRDDILKKIPHLKTLLNEWLSNHEKSTQTDDLLQDLHQQMALVKEAEANGICKDSLHTLPSRYETFRQQQETVKTAKKDLDALMKDSETHLEKFSESVKYLQNQQIQQFFVELSKNNDKEKIFDLVKEFLQNAGQIGMIQQCEASENEVSSVQEQQNLSTGKCLNLLQEYWMVYSQCPLTYLENHRMVYYLKWLTILKNSKDFQTCENVLQQFYSFANSPNLSKQSANSVLKFSYLLNILYNQALAQAQKAFEELSKTRLEEPVLILEKHYTDAKICLANYLQHEKNGSKALEFVILSELLVLNRTFLTLETAASKSGDWLIKLTSREGDWFLDELTLNSSKAIELISYLTIYDSIEIDVELMKVVNGLNAANNVYKALHELNFNFHTIILPESMKKIQSEEKSVVDMVRDLREIILGLGVPLQDLVVQLEKELTCVVMEMDHSPTYDVIQTKLTTLKHQYQALLQHTNASEILTPGKMLLMGFNGLFDKLNLESNNIINTLGQIQNPNCWRKLDQVKDAKSLTTPIFNQEVKKIIEDVFLLKRINAMYEFFAMCTEMCRSFQKGQDYSLFVGQNCENKLEGGLSSVVQGFESKSSFEGGKLQENVVIYNDEQLIKPIRKYIADFISKQFLGVTTEAIAYVICFLLQRLGLNVTKEIEQKDIGAENKVPLEELYHKGWNLFIKNGLFSQNILAETSTIQSNVKSAWEKIQKPKMLEKTVALMQSSVQRLQNQLSAHFWIHEDLLTLAQNQEKNNFLRSKFLTDLHNKTNNLKALHIKNLELREKQKVLIASISQRLKWAAGANPDLNEILSAFETSLQTRDSKLEIEQKISDLTLQTSLTILKHEILRNNSAEAKNYDQLFLSSYQKWVQAFQFSNLKIENVTKVEENIMRLYTKDLVNNPKWIKIIAEKISDVIKATQKESSDYKQELDITKYQIHNGLSEFKTAYSEHCKIMLDFKNLIKSMTKIEESSLKSQQFIADYRDYIERFTNLIHRFKKDSSSLKLSDVEFSLGDMDYLVEKTEDLYAGLLELEGRRLPGLSGADKRRLVRQDGVSLSPVRLRDLKQESMTRGQQRNAYAVNVWRRIRAKLEGRDPDPGRRYTTQEQVDYVIREATSLDNLCLLYEGWTPWV